MHETTDGVPSSSQAGENGGHLTPPLEPSDSHEHPSVTNVEADGLHTPPETDSEETSPTMPPSPKIETAADTATTKGLPPSVQNLLGLGDLYEKNDWGVVDLPHDVLKIAEKLDWGSPDGVKLVYRGLGCNMCEDHEPNGPCYEETDIVLYSWYKHGETRTRCSIELVPVASRRIIYGPERSAASSTLQHYKAHLERICNEVEDRERVFSTTDWRSDIEQDMLFYRGPFFDHDRLGNRAYSSVQFIPRGSKIWVGRISLPDSANVVAIPSAEERPYWAPPPNGYEMPGSNVLPRTLAIPKGTIWRTDPRSELSFRPSNKNGLRAGDLDPVIKYLEETGGFYTLQDEEFRETVRLCKTKPKADRRTRQVSDASSGQDAVLLADTQRNRHGEPVTVVWAESAAVFATASNLTPERYNQIKVLATLRTGDEPTEDWSDKPRFWYPVRANAKRFYVRTR